MRQKAVVLAVAVWVAAHTGTPHVGWAQGRIGPGYGNGHASVTTGRAAAALEWPRTKVEWNLPGSFAVGDSAAFAVKVCNEGYAATLFTEGTFGGRLTGQGTYSLGTNECIGLGFFGGGSTVRSTDVESNEVCITHRSTLSNSAGKDMYWDRRCVPVDAR